MSRSRSLSLSEFCLSLFLRHHHHHYHLFVFFCHVRASAIIRKCNIVSITNTKGQHYNGQGGNPIDSECYTMKRRFLFPWLFFSDIIGHFSVWGAHSIYIYWERHREREREDVDKNLKWTDLYCILHITFGKYHSLSKKKYEIAKNRNSKRIMWKWKESYNDTKLVNEKKNQKGFFPLLL